MRLDNIFEGIMDALSGGDGSRREQQQDEVQSARRDPFGDPADEQPRDIRSSNEDPYGDPADERDGEPILSSNRDPYGDPADRHG